MSKAILTELPWFLFKHKGFFLHLHEIVEIVCVCVSFCLCVSIALLVNKIPAERMHQFGRGFRETAAYYTGLAFGDLGSKVKVKVTQYPFFLHISLLTSLLYISALLCLIKLKLVLECIRMS